MEFILLIKKTVNRLSERLRLVILAYVTDNIENKNKINTTNYLTGIL